MDELALPVERMPQPEGLRGGRHSLATLARLAVEAKDDMNIRRWVSHLLLEEGLTAMDVSYEANIARARAILRWCQEKVAWIPDPKGREHLVKPYLLLPCRDGTCDRLPVFAGGDCDDKTALLCALLLEALATVDIPVAAIGHGYRSDVPVIQHVLAAIGADPQWSKHYYLDPSTKLPFGECYPFEWEQVISLPDLRVLCDAEVCLGSRNMGTIVSAIGQPGGNVDEMHVVGRVPGIDALAWARAQRAAKADPVAWARAQRAQRAGGVVGAPMAQAQRSPTLSPSEALVWARGRAKRKPSPLKLGCPKGQHYDSFSETCICDDPSHMVTPGGCVPTPLPGVSGRGVGALPAPEVYQKSLASTLDDARLARDRFVVATQEADRILASLGESSLPGWTDEERQNAGRALAAVELLVRWLVEALDGVRKVVVDPAEPEDQWSLDGLPGDNVIVTGNSQAFALENRTTGEQSPSVSGAPVGITPEVIGIVLVVAAALGFVAIHGGAAYLAISVVNRATETLLRALEAYTIVLYNRCLEKNPASACTLFVKAIGEARLAAGKAAAIERGARDKVTLDLLSIGKWVLGITAATLLGLGIERAYVKYFEKPAGKKRKKAA